MNIDRHNYETFFLLYVDNELSADERKAVELFVQENPDLQVELSSLQDTVLKADDVALNKKDWLYKEDGITVLRESLLLYADNELSESDKRKVEALLAIDKTSSAEWNIIRQTKAEPDTSIVFENKRSLYRKEEGTVVAIRWWRVAAAAVLLGFGLWAGLSVYRNTVIPSGPAEVAGNPSNDKSGQRPDAQAKNNNAVEVTGADNIPANSSNVIATVPGKDNSTVRAEAKNNSNEEEKSNKKSEASERNNISVNETGNKKDDNNLPKPYFENINNPDRNQYTATNVTPENNIGTSGANGVVIKTNPVVSEPAATTAAIPVVYTDEGNNNDRFLYMDEEKVKRSKLGGFIRKAKRILERTANVKTGDGLKVAGFEIALK